MVIYPEGIWYTFVDTEDVEEVIQSHLIQGRVVERLQLI
jgi:(2Fe-2S) ferredoxin